MILLLAPFSLMRIAVQIPMTREKLAKGNETNTQQQVKFYACSLWWQILVIPELRDVTEEENSRPALAIGTLPQKQDKKRSLTCQSLQLLG